MLRKIFLIAIILILAFPPIIFSSENKEEETNYCWIKTLENSAYIEFPCEYADKYRFKWLGNKKFNEETNLFVADGDGYLVLVRRSDGYHTGKLRATFEEGILISDLTIPSFFYKCLDKSCEEITFNDNDNVKFYGRIKFDSNDKKEFLGAEFGTLLIDNSSYYRGSWEGNRPDGYGFWCNARSVDEVKLYEWSKQYRCDFPSTFLDGYWKDGSFKQGYAREFYSDGTIYQGEGKVSNNILQPDGWGEIIWADGNYYQGELKNGKREGFGIYIYSDGSIYKGEWKNNLKDGYGELFISKGKIYYLGGFKNGKYNGQAILKFFDNTVILGTFYNNSLNGEGLVYFKNKFYKAIFNNNSLIFLYPLNSKSEPIIKKAGFDVALLYIENIFLSWKLKSVWNSINNKVKKVIQWTKENSEHIINAGKG